MNNTITNPQGIDFTIQRIQEDLYNELILKWVDDIDGYGRIYKNINATNNTITPQWYLGNKEYKNVYYRDEFSGSFMFIDSDRHTTKDEVFFETKVKVVFMLDLNRILPNETDRADAIAQNDAVEILRNIAFGKFNITGITKGIKNVFNGFTTDSIKFTDIQPYHCFSVDIDLTYYLTDKC